MNAVTEALRVNEGVLIGGAYSGPSRRQPFGDAAKAMRLVTHLQTPRAACQLLVRGLSKLLKK